MSIKKELKGIGTDFISGLRTGLKVGGRDTEKKFYEHLHPVSREESDRREVGKTSITYKGKKYTRYKAGQGPYEKQARREGQLGPREVFCECGREYGQYHLLGCDCEDCPICKGQLLSCGHGALFETKYAKCR